MSLLMAFVVLFSTLSFTVSMHYCGDTLVETAVFQKVKGCGMAMEQPSSNDCAITKKNCCKDKQMLVVGQDELQLQVDNISFGQQFFVASFIKTYIDLFEGLDTNVASYEAYRPPLVIKQIFKIDESYLI
jgi:hypothetical protein